MNEFAVELDNFPYKAMMCSAAFHLRVGTDEEFGGGGSLNVI